MKGEAVRQPDPEYPKFQEMPLLTKGEEWRLAIDWQRKGKKEAKDMLMVRNQGLVISIAKKYMAVSTRSILAPGFTIFDLIQEGNLGLDKAVDMFDYRRGVKFGTYATWWIKQAIRSAIIKTNSIVSIPGPTQRASAFKKRIITLLVSELGRAPTEEEIDARILVTKKTKTLKLELKSLDNISVPGPVQSYNKVLTNGSKERTPLSFISDPAALPPDTPKHAREVYDDLASQLRELVDAVARFFPKPDTQHVFFMREGLAGYPQGLTLEEVGVMCVGVGSRTKALTRERVRQIQEKVWQRLGLTQVRLNHPQKLSVARERFEVIGDYLVGVNGKRSDD